MNNYFLETFYLIAVLRTSDINEIEYANNTKAYYTRLHNKVFIIFIFYSYFNNHQ